VIPIFLNGEQRVVTSSNLHELLGELQLTGKRIAIEVNLEIVPRSAFTETPVRECDRIEIVQAIGGG
jgi:sulfur carrier protein